MNTKKFSLAIFFMLLTFSVGLVSVNLPLSINAQNSALSQDEDGEAGELRKEQEQSSNQDNQVVTGDSTISSGNNLLCETMDKSTALESIGSQCSDSRIGGVGGSLDPIDVTIQIHQTQNPMCQTISINLCNQSIGGYYLHFYPQRLFYDVGIEYWEHHRQYIYKDLVKDPNSGEVRMVLEFDYDAEDPIYKNDVKIYSSDPEAGNHFECVRDPPPLPDTNQREIDCEGLLKKDARIIIDINSNRR